MSLPRPFDTFRLEMQPGDYKDFHVSPDDPYPLKGVTYPTQYGDIEGYTGEDGHPLDVFVGTGNILGFFQVYRPDVEGEIEHKFCLNLTNQEESQVLEVFAPVLREHGRFDTLDELIEAMEPFREQGSD